MILRPSRARVLLPALLSTTALLAACAGVGERAPKPQAACCAAPADASAGAANPPAPRAGDERSDVASSSQAPRSPDAPRSADAAPAPKLPDATFTDQDGRTVRLVSELVRDRIVVLDFVFTTCTTICPALSANFGKLQEHLGERAGRDVVLVSVSVDPKNDTPARLKAFGATFGAGPGWTLLTGEKADVDALQKALGVFSARKEDHTPLVLVGDPSRGAWKRIDGLAPPATLARVVDEFTAERARDAAAAPSSPSSAAANSPAAAAPSSPSSAAPSSPASAAPSSPSPTAPAKPVSAAQAWFTDTELVDQTGAKKKFYTDLMQGKVVVIDCFFSECTGVCPVMSKNMRSIMELAGDRLDKDVRLISISVDPAHDTPEKLAEYARTLGAKPGWSFLTGSKADLDKVLGKLGFAVQAREEHSNLILIGNDKTGLWKKAFGLAEPEAIVKVFESVLNDDGR